MLKLANAAVPINSAAKRPTLLGVLDFAIPIPIPIPKQSQCHRNIVKKIHISN